MTSPPDSEANFDHKIFVKTLSPALRAELTEARDGTSLTHLTLHGLALLLMVGLVGFAAPLWPLWMLGLGILISFLFTIEHEATHHTVVSGPKLNDWIGRFCGLAILLPFEWFRYFHLAHHRHTNIPGKDPELMGGPRPDTWPAFLLHISGLPYWIAMIRALVRNASGAPLEDFVPKGAIPRIRREARVMLALYSLAGLSLIWTPFLLWVWILPALLGQPFLRLFLLAEHGHCPFVANMFENTRTTFTNRVVRYLTWNASYHVEHHTLPMVPSYNLPLLHEHMQKHLKVTSSGYVAFSVEYPKGFQTGEPAK